MNRRISQFGVPVHEVNICKRYAVEMLKAFRTETGEPLARSLSWNNLPFGPEIMHRAGEAAQSSI